MGTIAEQEREAIRKRQAEGIAAAKGRGVYRGRKSIEKPDNWDSVIKQCQDGEITATKAIELTGTKRTTFYKLVSEQGNKTQAAAN